jgi:hypothetical protein
MRAPVWCKSKKSAPILCKAGLPLGARSFHLGRAVAVRPCTALMPALPRRRDLLGRKSQKDAR